MSKSVTQEMRCQSWKIAIAHAIHGAWKVIWRNNYDKIIHNICSCYYLSILTLISPRILIVRKKSFTKKLLIIQVYVTHFIYNIWLFALVLKSLIIFSSCIPISVLACYLKMANCAKALSCVVVLLTCGLLPDTAFCQGKYLFEECVWR